MNTKLITTDDASFREYLNGLCHDCLSEHVAANFLPEVITDILLNNEQMRRECAEFLMGSKNLLSATDELRTVLENSSDEEIIQLMKTLFSKKALIDALMEYTDEGTREDIFLNQEEWERIGKEQ